MSVVLYEGVVATPRNLDQRAPITAFGNGFGPKPIIELIRLSSFQHPKFLPAAAADAAAALHIVVHAEPDGDVIGLPSSQSLRVGRG
jgi:hypothetical protein